MKCRKEWNSVYGKMALVCVSAAAVSLLVFIADSRKTLPKTEEGYHYVSRNQQGKGGHREELQVQIGDAREPYTVEVQEQKYTREALQQAFTAAGQSLEKAVLGENKSLDEVRSDLKLVSMIPDTGIRVSWELDNYEVINLQGQLQTEHLSEEGTLVALKALLSYGEEKTEYCFYARLFPPILSASEKMVKRLDEEIARLDEESAESGRLLLPYSLEGEAVVWKYAKNFRAAGILLVGLAMALFLYVAERQKEKDRLEARKRQMERDYPRMVSKFTLFLGAGMTVRNAWCRIAGDYERQKEERGEHEVYEEMVYTMYEMKGGASESECYERFGDRCGLQVYRKFGTMLSQNLRKGTRGLSQTLTQESSHVFDERKDMAKRLGEEAGTKILIPMFMMLAVVLIIIVVPAFLSMQI